MSAHRDPDQFVAVIDESDGICYLFTSETDATRWAEGYEVSPFAELDSTTDQFKQMMAAADA